MTPYIGVMRRILPIALSAALVVTPAAAQDSPTDGFDLRFEGARRIMRHLMEEMGSTLENLDDLADDLAADLGPAMEELRALIDDLSVYQPPEMLPNGDIIIRRKPPPEGAPPGPEDAVEI